MIQLVDTLVKAMIYMGLVVGAWLILYPFLIPALNSRKRYKKVRGYTKGELVISKKSPIYRNLELLLSVTLNTKTPYAVLTFVLGTLSIFSISMIFLMQTQTSILAKIILAIVFASLPYLFLRMKLHTIRIDSSYEAEKLVTEIINQYKINYLNMVEAIDETVMNIKHAPYSKKALFRMALAVKKYRTDDELENIIKEFNFAINTDWAMLLSNNIFLSIYYNDDVREGLEDILEDLKDLKAVVENDKQYNNEAFVMVKYIVPGAYLLSVLAMFKVFGFTFEKFIDYQFINPMGFKMFVITFICYICSYVLYIFMRKPKNDF